MGDDVKVEEALGTQDQPTSVKEDSATTTSDYAPAEPAEQSEDSNKEDKPPTELDSNKKEEDPSPEQSAAAKKPENETKEEEKKDNAEQTNGAKSAPVVSASKRSRPPFKYDPTKITLRFLFSNRDGLTVTVECNPADTVSEVKGALLSVWPDDLPACAGSDSIRLICMGKGMLAPDSRTLEDCQIPVFKTHPTPVNVAVRPAHLDPPSSSSTKPSNSRRSTPTASGGGGGTSGGGSGSGGGTPTVASEQASQGCSCVIL